MLINRQCDTQYGLYLKQHIQLSTRRSWVRHDEHYHVDFAVPCQYGQNKNKKDWEKACTN
ncbi:hypothetical protein BZJ20_08950 [Salinivibrio proteolyticus]|nr:hypothetical protein BZJ20_08950 [Salinivibrio proteolyticus]